MIEILSPREIEQMRPAGAFVGKVLSTLQREVRVGDNLLEIDARAHEMIREVGAESCYLDYAPSFGSGPFGFVICTSVNDAVLHGKPRDQKVQDGDLVTLDFAVSIDGWVCDSAVSFNVGTQREEDQKMIATATEALHAGIEQARVGNRIGDISHAIGAIMRGGGYGFNTDFGGHGVGSTMHGDPHIPNSGPRGRGMKLKEGLVIAIEPWLMAGTNDLITDKDGWTLRSADGSRTAHVEHTVAITKSGPIIMTSRD
ncbi:MAG: type I methionyl aminopeptidase [Cumulibacter sp.]